MKIYNPRGIVYLCLVATILPDLAFAYDPYDPWATGASVPVDQGLSWMSWVAGAGNLAVSAFAGGLVGLFFSHKLRHVRQWLFYAVILVSALLLFFYVEGLRVGVVFLAAMSFVLHWLRDRTPPEERPAPARPNTFGSAEWANVRHLTEESIIGDDGLFLGQFEEGGNFFSLCYRGLRHILCVAPTRAGKGVCSIIPNLIKYLGSLLVIDPKGENTMITAQQRRNLGQTVHVVDPWQITDETSSCFNPLDWLQPNDADISENAMILADSIVASRPTDEPFWDEEAKALLMGILLHVALDTQEQGQRHLGRVRDIIVSDDETFKNILIRMAEHPNRIVSSTAARTASKDPKLRASVLASLQAHTHFLDSPRIRESLSRSDFKFEDLKTSKMSIYLVLPADRLDAFGRWLRLLVQQAITVNARNITVRPDKPILFLLDEMPALGRLTMVEQAYGLMAGFGIQLFGIVQDLSQLERVYDKGWETFIGNSGVIQYFGSRDQKTADYFSKLCGVTTVEKFSFSNAFARGVSYARSLVGGGGSSTSSSTNTETFNTDVVQRHLAYPDELMVLRQENQLLFVENSNPIRAKKVKWFEDDRFKTLGRNLHNPS